MKLKAIMLAFAAVSINLHASSGAPPAPLPEFMNQQQMAQWNADRAVEAKTSSSSLNVTTQFYTGKPYVADAGGYVYKYRTYNPEMSRWTSADPSGFPDGANCHFYAPNPTCNLDPDGFAALSDSTSTLTIPTKTLLSSQLATAGFGALQIASIPDLSFVINLTASGAGVGGNPGHAPGISGETDKLTGTSLSGTITNGVGDTASWSVSVTRTLASSTPGTSVGGQPDLVNVYNYVTYVDYTTGSTLFAQTNSGSVQAAPNPSLILIDYE